MPNRKARVRTTRTQRTSAPGSDSARTNRHAARPAQSLAEYRRKRDFSKTREPAGTPAPPAASRRTLHFVIQKHAASHLHFDFRLELDGVMKSWAVPKGPSLDPAVKRLAMQVEDHPVEYNTFEGTIPKGEYGGGTVMLWDRGTYAAATPATPADDEAALRHGFERGTLDFTLHGERLQGAWTLIRTRHHETKPQWLLIKRRDRYARPDSDITAEALTSVATGRTMEEITLGAAPARGLDRQSRQAPSSTSLFADASRHQRTTPVRRSRVPTPNTLHPMLASIGNAIPAGSGWTFEPKYDGIRVLAFATPRTAKLITRNGKDKARQFPEIAAAVRSLASRTHRSLVLDGEIVGIVNGQPARFQTLQSRMHTTDPRAIDRGAERIPAAFFAFDLLADGSETLIAEPWSTRRRHLEAVLDDQSSPQIRISEPVPDHGQAMLDQARRNGWEGVIAKRTDSVYEPGKRTETWLKLKIENRQEFVVGGYTEPRNSRQYIGALLLGYFDGDRFIYVGNTGGGFDRDALAAMHSRLARLERKTSPFEETPRTNEPVHWVRPTVVVEVKFSEWTADGKLRQPIYLGTRDDKTPRDVGREPPSTQHIAAHRKSGTARVRHAPRSRTRASSAIEHGRRAAPATPTAAAAIVTQLDAIERSSGSGTLRLGRGKTLDVSSIDKLFFPQDRYTKGDLMRYYARVATVILPALADRPLVLKRSPAGIAGETFFQQHPPEHVPRGVRVESVAGDRAKPQQRLVGGDIATLLYAVQIGCISMDPWLSRMDALDSPELAILDLDPGPRAPFQRVAQVAAWTREELDRLRLHAALKTSGSRGLHIAIPLPAHTSYETALALAQLVATRVATAHPKEATVERAVNARPPAAVYVDYLQNARGKSVACAYCVRAKPGATVSMPLAWSELSGGLDPRAFTIESVPPRLAKLGDLWRSAVHRRNSVKALHEAADL